MYPQLLRSLSSCAANLFQFFHFVKSSNSSFLKSSSRSSNSVRSQIFLFWNDRMTVSLDRVPCTVNGIAGLIH